jgi:hypothetical protein
VTDRVSGATQLLNIPLPWDRGGPIALFSIQLAGFSANGRFALLYRSGFGAGAYREHIFYDREENRMVRLPRPFPRARASRLMTRSLASATFPRRLNPTTCSSSSER